MANSTVYPYGTGGHMPSNIGIINDLTTGGANNALSAEMGKYIGHKLSYFDTAECEEEGVLLVDENLNIGVKINDEGFFSVNMLTASPV